MHSYPLEQTNAMNKHIDFFPHSPVSQASVVQHLVDALTTTGGLPEVGWCLFVLSTQLEVCHLLVNHGIIGSAFNILEKLINEQASYCEYAVWMVLGKLRLKSIYILCIHSTSGSAWVFLPSFQLVHLFFVKYSLIGRSCRESGITDYR